MKRKIFSEQRRQVMLMGVSALAVPMSALAAAEPVADPNGGRVVVSGRVIGETDGKGLAGAQIEIWQVDARGQRAEASREVVAADGDGRYFAALRGSPHRLHYRVSHKDHTTKVTQLHVTSARQRAVTTTRDHTGAIRVAFEMTLAPRNMMMAGAAQVVAL